MTHIEFNETLKRDLCARLMEGVMMVNKEVNKTYFNPLILKGFRDEDCIYLHGLSLPQKLSNHAPILFPTSALTKPIQIASYNNGEPFVPLVEIKKNEMSKDPYSLGIVNWVEIYHKFGEFNLDNTPFFIIELLNQWHINYRLSPEQFIEVTDEFNPYK